MGHQAKVGTGPGVITPDGCAVDFYALLPPMGEPEIIAAAVAPGASILELGCGTGRLLEPLAGMGHPVLGVDESAAMLDRIPGLPTVLSSIETLDLGRTFDVVLLASNMINTVPAQRRAFLASCGRHVAPDGLVIFCQQPPDWFATLRSGDQRDVEGIGYTVRSVAQDGASVRVSVEYQVGDRRWTHAFAMHRISPEERDADLASAGLRFGWWLTHDRAWFTARPVEGRGGGPAQGPM